MRKKRHERLGKHLDLTEVLKHPWFAEIDPSTLIQKQYAAPYIPQKYNVMDRPRAPPIHSIVPQTEKELINTKKDVFQDFGVFIESSSGELDDKEEEAGKSTKEIQIQKLNSNDIKEQKQEESKDVPKPNLTQTAPIAS